MLHTWHSLKLGPPEGAFCSIADNSMFTTCREDSVGKHVFKWVVRLIVFSPEMSVLLGHHQLGHFLVGWRAVYAEQMAALEVDPLSMPEWGQS